MFLVFQPNISTNTRYRFDYRNQNFIGITNDLTDALALAYANLDDNLQIYELDAPTLDFQMNNCVRYGFKYLYGVFIPYRRTTDNKECYINNPFESPQENQRRVKFIRDKKLNNLKKHLTRLIDMEQQLLNDEINSLNSQDICIENPIFIDNELTTDNINQIYQDLINTLPTLNSINITNDVIDDTNDTNYTNETKNDDKHNDKHNDKIELCVIQDNKTKNFNSLFHPDQDYSEVSESLSESLSESFSLTETDESLTESSDDSSESSSSESLTESSSEQSEESKEIINYIEDCLSNDQPIHISFDKKNN